VSRIVLTTLGSLGDLHPYLAIARELTARGHTAVLATSEMYRARVEAEGVPFHPVRPDLRPVLEPPGALARHMDAAHGPERVVRELVVPFLADTYEDTLAAAAGAELLVGHPLTLTAPMAAEQLGIPWLSSTLAPFLFFSLRDPPVPPGAPWVDSLRRFGPAPFRLIYVLSRRLSAPWFEPVADLRARLGLPPAGHPVFEGAFSPDGTLALYPSVLGPPQPDWPAGVTVTGYCFLDHPKLDPLPEGLERFLDAGEPPIVFTLGTSAVHDARDFYDAARDHARALGHRAVLLIGRDAGNRVAAGGPDTFVADFAPYARLFPRAAAIVHQGGAGTTAEALRSGRPMLVLPFSHDQFDNAARVRRIGSGDTLDRHRWAGAEGRNRLARLLDSPAIAATAAANGERVRAEGGPKAAAEAILRVVGGRKPAEIGAGTARGHADGA
jgi:UDP:flavonoid glycosyltransferase YjiC (YdhE family)